MLESDKCSEENKMVPFGTDELGFFRNVSWEDLLEAVTFEHRPWPCLGPEKEYYR